jgi:phage gp46-like protein
MPDISTLWDTTRGDWRLSGVDLVSGDDLVTPVLMSLFTDREANPDDTLTDGSSDPRGWWGDEGPYLIGSRLWLLERAKRTQQTLSLAQGYIEEALQWMIDDGVVDRFDVTVEWTRHNMLGARVTVYRKGRAPQLIEVEQQPSGIAEVSEWGWNADAQGGEWQPRILAAPEPSSPPPSPCSTPVFVESFSGTDGTLISSRMMDVSPAGWSMWDEVSASTSTTYNGIMLTGGAGGLSDGTQTLDQEHSTGSMSLTYPYRVVAVVQGNAVFELTDTTVDADFLDVGSDGTVAYPLR